MIRIILFILIFSLELSFATKTLAQDPVFSAFYNNSLYYNPASPGLIVGNQFNLNFREQWPGIPASNRSFNFSSMHTFCNAFSLGVLATSNIEGESKLLTNNIGLTIAVPVKISRFLILSTGATTTYAQKRIDWTRVEFDDQYDKLYGKVYDTKFPFPNEDRKNYGDLSLGMALKGRFYKKRNTIISGSLGVGLHHVLVFPNPNFIGSDINAIPFKQVYHMDVWLLYGRKRNVKGFAMSSIYEKQGHIKTFNLSFRYLIKSLYLLGGFRNTSFTLSPKKFDSFILGFGYIYQEGRSSDYIKFGYSYDFTVSKLVGGAYGSHEIYITYSLGRCNSLSSKKRGGRKNPNKECQQMEFNPGGLFLHR